MACSGPLVEVAQEESQEVGVGIRQIRERLGVKPDSALDLVEDRTREV